MVKPVIFFARLSGTKSEILEKTLMMFNGTCWQIYFRKKNSKREILDYLYFYLYYLYLFRFFFGGGAVLECFSQCFFMFSSSANHGGRHFCTAPPTIKKLPTVLINGLVQNVNSFYVPI